MKTVVLGRGDHVHIQRWLEISNNGEKNLSVMPRNLLAVHRLLKKRQCKIQVHYLGWNAIKGLILAFLYRIKLDGVVWGSDIQVNSKNIIKRFILRSIINRFEDIAVEGQTSNLMLRKLGYKGNVHPIRFGVAPEVLRASGHPVRDFSDRRCILSNVKFSEYVAQADKCLLSYRSSGQVYRLPKILKAVEKLVQQGCNPLLILAGVGTDEQRYLNFGLKPDLIGRVFFWGRFTQSELRFLVDVTDVQVSISASDSGLSSTTAEIMTYGGTVLVNNLPDNIVHIKDMEQGIIWRESEGEDLAAALVRGLKTSPKSEIGINAQHYINQVYNKNLGIVEFNSI